MNTLIAIGAFFTFFGLVSFAFGLSLYFSKIKKQVNEDIRSEVLSEVDKYMPTLKIEGDQTVEVIKSGRYEYTVRTISR